MDPIVEQLKNLKRTSTHQQPEIQIIDDPGGSIARLSHHSDRITPGRDELVSRGTTNNLNKNMCKSTGE